MKSLVSSLNFEFKREILQCGDIFMATITAAILFTTADSFLLVNKGLKF